MVYTVRWLRFQQANIVKHLLYYSWEEYCFTASLATTSEPSVKQNRSMRHISQVTSKHDVFKTNQHKRDRIIKLDLKKSNVSKLTVNATSLCAMCKTWNQRQNPRLECTVCKTADYNTSS